MKRWLTYAALVGALTLGVGTFVARAGSPDDTSDMPARHNTATLSDAAAKAINAAFPTAKVGRTTETKGVFTVALSENDKKSRVTVSESGIIISVASLLDDVTTLPKAVTDAVTTAFPDARITSATKIEQRAESAAPYAALAKPAIHYEVRVSPKDKPRTTMQINEDGTIIPKPTQAPKTTTPPATPAPASTSQPS